MTTLLAATLILLIVVAVLRPRRRGRRASRTTRSRRTSRPGRDADAGLLVTEVAARLRAGASVAEAWRHSLQRAGLNDDSSAKSAGPSREAGTLANHAAAVSTSSTAVSHRAAVAAARGPVMSNGVPVVLMELVQRRRTRPGQAAALTATIAACRLTHEIGAPLAEVLDRCAAGITEAGQAQNARRVALAGPRATARVLVGLPVLGLLFGSALGADPVTRLLDGGWGSAAGAAGLVLYFLGWRWSALLTHRAERDSGVPAKRRAR